MKRYLCMISTILCILFLTACTAGMPNDVDSSVGTTETPDTVDSFSYAEDSSRWISGEIGMKTEDFKNDKAQEIKNAEDALSLAKNEVTVSYDRTAVAYDKNEKIWRVDFWSTNHPGGNQIVYLNSDGTTKICIWEE